MSLLYSFSLSVTPLSPERPLAGPKTCLSQPSQTVPRVFSITAWELDFETKQASNLHLSRLKPPDLQLPQEH